MTWINTITDYPNQVLTLVLPGGTNIQFSLWYSDGQQGWLYSFTYGTFSISNKRIVVGANLLRAFRNLLPFGIAVTTTDVVPPLQAITPALEEAANTVGCVTVPDVVEVHPLASVTVYEYAPALTVKEPVPV